MKPWVGAIVGGGLGALTGEPAGIAIGGLFGFALAASKNTKAKLELEAADRLLAESPSILDEEAEAPLDSGADLTAFLHDAVRDGVIEPDIAQRLIQYRNRRRARLPAVESALAATTVPPAPGLYPTVRVAKGLPAWVGTQPPQTNTGFATLIHVGTILEVVERRGGFTRVRIPEGRLWWVESQRLAADSTAVSAGPVAPAPAARPATVKDLREAFEEPTAPAVEPRQPSARPTPRPRPTPPSKQPARSAAARGAPPEPGPGSWEPRPVEPSVLAIGLRRLGKASVGMWKTFSADVAIHALTYFGVLLLTLVIFAFYGLGFYGEMVRGERWAPWRPVVATALPLTLFGLAWLLRVGTGIAFTANAIGFLGAVSLPIMLASLFQDGAPWGPPDLDGPVRWFGYAAVGAICAVVYTLAAKRAAIYAYLVGPGIWVAAGALGLFLEDAWPLWRDGGIDSFDQFTSDGISWVQMTAVLLAMALTFAAVRLSPWRGTVAAAVVRSGLVVLPVVAGLAVAFALIAGISGVSADFAAASVLALTGLVALLGGTAGFAWSDLGAGLRRWIRLTLSGIAIVAFGAAWVATRWIGIPDPWVAYGLAVYCAVVLFVLPGLGISLRPAVAALRVVGLAGLLVAVIDPWSSIVSGLTVAGALAPTQRYPQWARGLSRVVPLPESLTVRTVVMAVGWATATIGVARAIPPAAIAPAVLAAGLVLALARFVPPRDSAIRDLSPLSLGFVAAGIAVVLVRFEAGHLTRVESGWHLLAAAGVVAIASTPWLIRLPALVLALVPGAAFVLRATGASPAVLDASTLAITGVGLLALAAMRRDSIGVEANLIGHLLVWAAPALGARTDLGLWIGTAAVALTHLAMTVAGDRDRMLVPFWPASPQTMFHAVVGAAALPLAAVLAAREIAWVGAERPRAALVVALVAWLLAGVGALLRTSRLRNTMVNLAGVLGVLATAVAIPATTEVLATAWSAAALLGWASWTTRSPVRSVPAWLMALVATILTGARLGVGRSDLHEPLLVGAIVLVALGSIAHRRGEPRRAWGLPPLYLGLLMLPAIVSLSIADGDRIALASLTVAAVYAALGWVLRTGAFVVLVAAMAAIAYADLLPPRLEPLGEPLMWLPLGAAYLAVAAAQRTRQRGHWLRPVVPGLLVASGGVAGLAAAVAAGSADFPLVLLGSAVLIDGAAARWRSWATAYAALAVVAWAGLAAGGIWLPVALCFDALALAVEALWRVDARARKVLAPMAVALAAAGYAALGWWQQWSKDEVMLAMLGGAAVAGIVGWVFRLWGTGPRLAMWRGPFVVLQWLALVGSTAAGFVVGEYWIAAALGLDAAAFAAEAIWRPDDQARTLFAPAAAALAAGGYGALGWWQQWSADEALVALGVAALVCGPIALALTLLPVWPRLGIWRDSFHVLTQAALVGFAAIGLEEYRDTPDMYGAPAVTLAAETAGVALWATVRRRTDATALCGAVGVVALALGGLWQDLDPAGVVVYGGGIAAFAAVLAILLVFGSKWPRAGMWWITLWLVSQAAGVVTGVAMLRAYDDRTAAAAIALLLAAETVVLATIAIRSRWRVRLRLGAAASVSGAVLFGAAAIANDTVAGIVTLAIAVAAAALMAIASQPGPRWWGMPALVAAWTLTAGSPVLAARLGSEWQFLAVALVGGAGIALGAIVGGRWRLAYLGMGEGMLALAGWPWPGDREMIDVNVLISVGAVLVIAVLAMERTRARLLGVEITAEVRQLMSATEVVAMGVALGVAGTPAFTRESTGHLLLLSGESLVLMAWAFLSRVRRRLAVGALGLVAVAVYPIVRVVAGLAEGGMRGGEWIGIGAAIAVLALTVSALLDRYGSRLGAAVRRLVDLLEDWS